ncbi:4-hydroxythreonine-4-phosphate dehydrogenase PdxA [Lysobacteraceae bacterium NML08-0793]|nr:4-hydroxythreonine-4-phosphate dehydrogenase PdxA [Xanthomonadaceae bacterium NML08-0793]
MLPRLALVPGEPAGIGPELCVRLVQNPAPGYRLLAFADPATLLRAARALGLPLRLLPADARAELPGDLPLQPVALPGLPPAFGKPDPANAAATVASLRMAATACLEGLCDGLVTGPTHKASINQGGIAYTGTTELLAELADCEVAMMLARPDLRVVLATTHLPLREVAAAITAESLTRILRITAQALHRDFAVQTPRIAVLGLNPHAGEAGHLGREEIDIIIPVLDSLRAEGHRLLGPLPADTAFLPQKLPDFDAVVAMYHDQGLPVLKSAGLEQAVNITLGLPFPRVAVDHGAALDIAGRGLADVSSLVAAARQCAILAAHRHS